ncbi:hypothetical protein [Pseudonocardia zijingensis]|uniref:STAS domain-containing protein n=1 Tax=Pseudonocardia zijingensis TaxID=153376 RepID=A0ABP4A2P3_9PSEU
MSAALGSGLLQRQPVPMDLTVLVPVPRPVSTPERAELDVRLHAPTPDVVIVRVIGGLHRGGCAELVVRIGQQLHRARHVVLDLSSTGCLEPQLAHRLKVLHDTAVDRGTRLHIAAEDERVVEGLRRIDLADTVVCGTADAVLAYLATGNG